MTRVVMSSKSLYRKVITPWFNGRHFREADKVQFLFIWGELGNLSARSFLAQLCRDGSRQVYPLYKYVGDGLLVDSRVGGWMDLEDSEFTCIGAETKGVGGITFVLLKTRLIRAISEDHTPASLLRTHKDLSAQATAIHSSIRFTLY